MPVVSIPASSGQGSAPDAATIVTADMAASIIGGSPTKVPFGSTMPGGFGSVVSYATGAGDAVTVFVESVPGTSAAVLQTAMAMAGQQGDLQSVSGLGDIAAKEINPNEATYAFVKGQTMVIIGAQSGSISGSDLDSKVLAVARQVADQL